MGTVDALLKISKSNSLEKKYKVKLWEVISTLCSHPKVVRKLLVPG
jgi:hypothetical protein